MAAQNDPGQVAAVHESATQPAGAVSGEAEAAPELSSWNYAVLIYPFFHRFGAARADRLRRADKRWQHWLLRLSGDDLVSALDDTYFFLPHVRELIFPEVSLLDVKLSGPPQAAALQKALEGMPLAELTADDPTPARGDGGAVSQSELRRSCFQRGMLRVTLRDDELNRFRSLVMKTPSGRDGHPGIPLNVEWVDVALFPHDIGLLMLKVQVPMDDIRQMVNAFECARHVFQPQVSFTPVQLTSDPSHSAAKWSGEWRTLVEYLLTEFVDQAPAPYHGRRESALVAYTLSSDAQVYGETFRQLIAVAQPASRVSEEQTSHAGPFASQAERWLHDLIIGHDSSEIDWTPSRERRDAFRERSTVSYWKGWRAGADWGNLAFLLESGNFVNGVVRYNIEYDYLPVFMLATFLQIRLQKFSGEIISKGRELRKNAAEATDLWAELIEFRNRYWFRQVTIKPVGGAIYRLLLESLDLEGIERTVVAELEALRAHLRDVMDRREQRIQRRRDVAIAIVTLFVSLQVMLFLFPQPPVPWSFLPAPDVALARWIYLGLIVGCFVVVGLLFTWPFRSKRQR